MNFKAEFVPNSWQNHLERKGGNDCVRPALHEDIYRYSLLLLLSGLCKAGRAHYWGLNLKSATRLALGGSHFFSEWQVSCSSPVVGLRFKSKLA